MRFITKTGVGRMKKQNKFLKKIRTISLLFMLLAVSLVLSSCIKTGEDPAEYKDNYVKVQYGYLSTGKLRDYISYGDSFTVYAEELPGMYFDHWTRNGERIEGGPVLEATADEKSIDESAEVVYRANYVMSEYASFEDVPLGSLDNIVSDRYNVYLNSYSDAVSAEIVKDPDDPYNKIVKYSDLDGESSGALHIDIAAVQGEFLVYGLDFLIDSFSGSVPMSVGMGNYEIILYSVGDELRVCDASNGRTAYLKTGLETGAWHNLTVYVCNSDVNGKPPHSFVFLDGECIAESQNVSDQIFSTTVSVNTSAQSRMIAYFDNIISHRISLTPSEELAMDPAFVLEQVSINVDAYSQAEMILDEDALAALKAMDEALFSEDIYRWIANLYDPETSAIYFSISGRDNYGYLPDIETVAQAYGILSTLGIGSSSTVLNDAQKANLLSWIQTLQSNRDGYYYHPHWGVSIGNSRLSRDLGNSGSSYSPSGSQAFRLFDDANYRLSNGRSGYSGVTSAFAYDNSLTPRMSESAARAVSKLLLTSSISSMPYHLRSEENLVRHINDQWNNTCKLSGTHERHFCTDACVIVEDSSDSYMKIVGGKLVITRGYRCTSCHECKHTTGHSYSFGHYVTSMGSQIKSAGLGTPTVMYFYDIQENVQASLRDKAQAKYIADNGQYAWDTLSELEKADVRKSAENGIWEEQVTYNTISGLLKISGIPGTHGYEFLYAEAAISSAIDGALFSTEDFIARREAIVSIYNPFNAINAIMRNIDDYGSDPSIKTEAMAIIRTRAKELIDNTAVKLSCYLMPDGGYSYSMSGYCVNSQGQPVAVEGWNNGVGEGDVNGTALALGTRGALISCLGITVGAPFSGNRAKYGDGGYDLDGNGAIEGERELNATHTDVFKSLITNKSEIVKVDFSMVDYNYDFEGEDPLLPSSGELVLDGNNKVLSVTDSQSGKGLYTTFRGTETVGEEAKTNIRLDMKVIESNNTVTHQLFAGSSNSLYINFTYSSGTFTFTNVASSNQRLYDTVTGKEISVNAKEWFSLDIDVYVSGKNVDGHYCYGVFRVTQNGKTQTAYLNALYRYSAINEFDMYSLNSAVNTVCYDNAKCTTSVVAGVYDGEYHFDSVTQQIIDGIVTSPTNKNDRVYPIESGSTASFDPHMYSTGSVIYNFNFFQGQLNLGEALAGDRVYYYFKDASGKLITGIYLEMNQDGTVTVYAANGQKLKMANTNRTDVSSPEMIDMTLNADTARWLTVKLEYHYDMTEPQFDIVVRYADKESGSYYKTVAATLTNVITLESGASASDFESFDIEYQSSENGKIYLDDMYIRNVYTP